MSVSEAREISQQGAVLEALAFGATTSVGSLPHRDRREAIEFVLERTPELPAAPTLPALEPLEMMIPQALWGVHGVDIGDDGLCRVDDYSVLDPCRPVGDPELLGRPFETWRMFLAAIAGRTSPIKLQLTGPITTGLVLVDAGVPPELAFQVSAQAVTQRTRSLIALADRLAPGVGRLIMFDEPSMVGGLRSELMASADQIVDLLSGALAAAESGATTGVHVCGSADWRLVLQAGPQVLSMPVGADVTASAGAIGSFLERGGWIAWGAVPTDGPMGEKPSRFWRQLSAQWCELVQNGCDPVLLRRQALVTPVCGLAMHDEVQADHVFGLCRALSEKIHDQVTGIRLSVGA